MVTFFYLFLCCFTGQWYATEMSRDTSFAQRALAANDTEFGDDGYVEASASSFAPIIERLTRQTAIAQNIETPDDDGDATSQYVSRAGLDTLFAGNAPRLLYLPEGRGARARPDGAVVDQVVLHSFGYAVDRIALRSGARSIQVDDIQTGHNPYKLAQRVQQVLFGQRESTSHLISRRGDIVCATPWNRGPAVNATGAARNLGVPERSISIELESWHTTYHVPFRGTDESDFKVLGLMPYTPRQLTALSWLLKKLGVWCGADVSKPLGFTFSEVRGLLGTASGHTPGIVGVGALAQSGGASPGGEFEYPAAWVLGDPIPSHLNEDLYKRRNDIYYAGVAAGAPLSHYGTVARSYASQPAYEYGTEIFSTRPTPVFETQQTAVVGTAAIAQQATNASGSGYARSEELQNMTRTGMYSAQAVSNDSVVREATVAATNQATVVQQSIATPQIRSALAFDFGRGEWVLATSRVVAGTMPVPNPPAPTAPTTT